MIGWLCCVSFDLNEAIELGATIESPEPVRCESGAVMFDDMHFFYMPNTETGYGSYIEEGNIHVKLSGKDKEALIEWLNTNNIEVK